MSEVLEVGAVYIAPASSSPMKLCDDIGAKLSVILPSEVVNKPTEMVATGITFLSPDE